MGAWKHFKKDSPCPICGHDGWCSYTEDGAVTCHQGGGGEVAGWKIIKAAGSPRTGREGVTTGTVYRRIGDDRPGMSVVSMAERELQAKEDEKKRKAAVAWAYELWSSGVPDHPAAAAYLEARGVPVSMLPGGKVTPEVRVTPDRTDWLKDAEGAEHRSTGPVMLCRMLSAAGRIMGVQRIFLQPGEAVKRRGFVDTKKGAGALVGGAIRLTQGDAELLIGCEGYETGQAIAAAMGGAAEVWAFNSTAGLLNIELPEGHRFKTFVFAQDHDRINPSDGKRPGARDAGIAAARLRQKYPGLRVGSANPGSAAIAPGLVDEQGEIIGDAKSVDWLDVYVKFGPQRVREAMINAAARAVASVAAPASTAATPSDEELDVLPENNQDRGVMAVCALYGPPAPLKAQSRAITLRRWNGLYLRHDGSRYVELHEEGVRKDVAGWLRGLKMWRTVSKKRVLVPCDSSPKLVSQVEEAIQGLTFVQVPQMPAWLPEDFDRGDDPLFSTRRPWETSLDPDEAQSQGLPRPDDVLVFEDGLFDLRAWLKREVRVLPNTPRFMCNSALPYRCPAALLEEVVQDDEDLLTKAKELAPLFFEMLGLIWPTDPASPLLLSQVMGLSMTAWTKHEVLPILTGESRAGKGAIEARWRCLLGAENVVSTKMHLLADRFHMYQWIGKKLAVMSDAEVGRNTDAMTAAEVIKNVTAYDPVYADRKNKDPLSSVQLTAKLLIVCNRFPQLPDASGALANRMLVLYFDRSFAGKERREFKDPEVIKREAMGVFLFALHGLITLEANGKFAEPERSKEILDEFRDYSDPLRTFVTECIELKADSWEATKELYARWKKWCDQVGKAHQSQAWFVQQLRTAVPGMRPKQHGEDRLRGYVGLALRRSIDEDVLPH